MTPEQRAEENRNRLEKVEAAAVLLLLRRRKATIERAVGAGFSLQTTAERLVPELATGIVQARSLAHIAAVSRVRAEVLALGIDARDFGKLATTTAADVFRATRIAERYAGLWLKRAQASSATTVGGAARSAGSETLYKVRAIGNTEAATAYNGGRLGEARRVITENIVQRVWDADFCKRMCSRCGNADGTIVGLRENFPLGEPGSVHVGCHCTWQLVTIERTARSREAA
jgi:hypothetical protein